MEVDDFFLFVYRKKILSKDSAFSFKFKAREAVTK